MPKIYECLVAKSAITEFITLNNTTLAYSTTQNGISLLDYQLCEIKINILHEKLTSDVKVLAFSPNTEMLTFVKKSKIYIIDLQTKKTIHKIIVEDEDIEIIKFDPSSTYIIAGTKNGRVLQFKYNKVSLLSRLCSFPHNRNKRKFEQSKNYVSAFAFYENTLACTGYGGAIFIIDLHSHANKNIITHSKARINAMCFMDKNILVSADDYGSVNITHLEKSKDYKTISTPLPDINQIIIMPNPDYILVSGKSNVISIIDVKNYKMTHSKYAEFSTNILKVTMINNELIMVALDNNEIVYIELPSAGKLKSLVLHNSLEEAYKLIDEEPMLQGSHEHKELEKKYTKDFKEAIQALINEDTKLAHRIIDVYKDIESKKEDIENLFKSFKNFKRFNELYIDKKYTLAYAMCSKFELLQLTTQYKEMEKSFKTAFINAQKQIILGNVFAAKELLFEYTAILSKKPIIQLILTQNIDFIKFLQAISKKDYIKINEFIQKDKLFTQIPNYINLNEKIKTILKNIKFSIKTGEIVVAKKLLHSIGNVVHLEDEIKELNIECKYVLILRKAYKENRFKDCYELIDSHTSLKRIELGIFLEKHWSKLMLKCEEYALAGNIKDIKKELDTLLLLTSRQNKIGDLIRVSFQVRIKMLIHSKNFRGAEIIIYTYIDLFGQDSEISQIMNNFAGVSSLKLALTQELKERPCRHSWSKSPIIVAQDFQ